MKNPPPPWSAFPPLLDPFAEIDCRPIFGRAPFTLCRYNGKKYVVPMPGGPMALPWTGFRRWCVMQGMDPKKRYFRAGLSCIEIFATILETHPEADK